MTSKDTLSSGELADDLEVVARVVSEDSADSRDVAKILRAAAYLRTLSPRGDSIGSSGGFDKDIGSSAALPLSASNVLTEKGTETYTRQDFLQFMLDERGVETPCRECGGVGVKTYGSTATWRGGVGGQTMTLGVCDRCWGSGDEHRKWPSHRAITAPLATEARYSGDGGNKDSGSYGERAAVVSATCQDGKEIEIVARAIDPNAWAFIDAHEHDDPPHLAVSLTRSRVMSQAGAAIGAMFNTALLSSEARRTESAALPYEQKQSDKARIERLDDVVKAAEEFVLCQNGQNSFYSLATNSFGRLEDALEKLRANP